MKIYLSLILFLLSCKENSNPVPLYPNIPKVASKEQITNVELLPISANRIRFRENCSFFDNEVERAGIFPIFKIVAIKYVPDTPRWEYDFNSGLWLMLPPRGSPADKVHSSGNKKFTRFYR